MRIDARTRRWIVLQNAIFTALLIAVIALAAWLSQRYAYTADWTAAGRNTLAERSRDVVGLLHEPVRATAYMPPRPVQRKSVRDLFDRYRRAGADIRLDFVNPETSPAIARELGIRSGGELILRYGEREQRLQRVSEQTITDALARLAREGERWIVFMEGHGERDPHGGANFDLQVFADRLGGRGMRIERLSLARTPHVPDNTDVLVLASPEADYLPGEVALIRQYVQSGGNLLWLTEPGAEGRLVELAADLGIRRRPGVVVDPTAQLFGTETPDFAVVGRYGDHPVSGELGSVTLFPQAAALEHAEVEGWSHTALLQSRPESWAETGPLEGELRPEPGDGDTPGPLTLGIAATRGPSATGESDSGAHAATGAQRIAVIGDGDFLSNAYIGNGANLDLGMRLVNWLAGDDAQVRIAPSRPPDIAVNLSQAALAIVGLGFLVAIPLLLAGTGLTIWLRRRRR